MKSYKAQIRSIQKRLVKLVQAPGVKEADGVHLAQKVVHTMISNHPISIPRSPPPHQAEGFVLRNKKPARRRAGVLFAG